MSLRINYHGVQNVINVRLNRNSGLNAADKTSRPMTALLNISQEEEEATLRIRVFQFASSSLMLTGTRPDRE
ncbi:hypothetical protein PHYBLDRAFT_141054 [Phycomyces blakesleeanus NRRL 1555(-)]|uniref:Uncharacterized protein n=1 Tax=Phycomyces blakesleeanus (strain ATCC 8743b / DSM 1359 / FGSC 10004 / NBRC 33097 / NRRL 1555) TaxID=763407 RepID=A0A167Q3C9_PHYB8|nr:hypothetical protein PHYBLDRAFT_141054 [Phycomyces blakesleeanus NRRL 1555(-)]OAD78999.1 hypothetical protein PHYBLDRAFT_141054 [Phycomyces blakesleeanus NRRL 1555(-)]|eukprot:XP_018297039.1 hypothetical protein PHYBLDRAFT_141054 [Phycomyces blakesleeanus NRRL 1555(-)]